VASRNNWLSTLIIILQVLLATLLLMRVLPLNVPHLFFNPISFAIVGDCFLIVILLVLNVRSETELQMKHCVRLLALASTTVCGIFFLAYMLLLLVGYNYKYHRFAPGIVQRSDFTATSLLGIGFLCSGILYRVLARKVKPISP
jgi:hypothetical protein